VSAWLCWAAAFANVQLALHLGHRPVIVDGGAQNVKITHPEDLEIVRLFLERKLGRSRVVRLTRPFVFEEVDVPSFPTGRKVSVRPLMGAICAADLRYYAGRRRPEALANKLPMALLHEGVGEVVFSPVPELPKGCRVAIVPNVKRCEDPACPACNDERIGANYCPTNAFLSSGVDGMAQSLMEVDPENLVRVPDEVPTPIAVMTEMLSVAVGALRRVDVTPQHRVAVVGDGPVGYGTRIVCEEILQRDVPMAGLGDAIPAADLYLEATGGPWCENAVNAIIDAALPGASVVLLGVSEERVPINTRDMLQKGLHLVGCSRSTPVDFARTLHFLRRPNLIARTKKLLIDPVFPLTGIREAFEFALAKKAWGKVLIELTGGES
jgi:ribitol-5-phosphate 2-dehydrogenase